MLGRAPRRWPLDWRHWDIRFAEADQEALFKLYLERHLLFSASIGLFILLLNVCWRLLVSYNANCTWEVNPFRWAEGDPRVTYFGVFFYLGASSALALAFCVVRLRYQRLRCVDPELLVLAFTVKLVFVLFLCSPWHASALSKVPADAFFVQHDNTRDEEFMTVIALFVGVTWTSMYVPIRIVRLWVLPVAAFCSYVLVLMTVGTQFPSGSVQAASCLGFLCVFAYAAAFRHEKIMRERWLAGQRVVDQQRQLETSSAVTSALKGVAGTLSDIILPLTKELRVLGSDQTHAAYFGRSVEGVSLTQLVGERDAEKLVKLTEVASSSRIMQAMPVTLQLQLGPVPAQLVVVSTGCSRPSFLVGIHIDDAEWAMVHDSDEVNAQDSHSSWRTSDSSVASASCGALGFAGPVFVEFDALDADLRVLSASAGWEAFNQPARTSLREQLDEGMFHDFQTFVREQTDAASRGKWDPSRPNVPFRKVDEIGPDGKMYRSVMMLTLSDPKGVPAQGPYPAVLSLEDVSKRRSFKRANTQSTRSGSKVTYALDAEAGLDSRDLATDN